MAQYIVSLPKKAALNFEFITGKQSPHWSGVYDPPSRKLGSGGGTVAALISSWRQTAPDASFNDWLDRDRKIVVHGGGQSRRLPAYAPLGKVLMPLPVCRWSVGQHLDQRLLDLQTDFFEQVAARAHPAHSVMVCSGDVLMLANDHIPALPSADVVCLGLWMSAAEAQRFGVFFSPRRNPQELAFTLQKPHPRKTHELARDYYFLVDIGVWLLSARALEVVIKKSNCGDTGNTLSPDIIPDFYDLYADFGPTLGTDPARHDPETAALSTAVVPLKNAEFYHFGTSSDLINSTYRLQNRILDQQRIGASPVKPHPDVFKQNAIVEVTLDDFNREMWIENAVIPSSWRLQQRHIITGIPENDWQLALPDGICLDIIPVDNSAFCLRPYHISDSFRGALNDPETRWLGKTALQWFEERRLTPKDAGLNPSLDIQNTPLFPVLKAKELSQEIVKWMIDPHSPNAGGSVADLWLTSEKLAAETIAARINPGRLKSQRQQHLRQTLPAIAANHRHSIFYKLDLEHVADLFYQKKLDLPAPLADDEDIVKQIHDSMFRSKVHQYRENRVEARNYEKKAFGLLRESLFSQLRGAEPQPRCSVQEDQIVWGRSPVRMDLAGGWTDTPPHTILHGGSVVNMAVDLNGQPPIQVYIRRRTTPEIVIRSIDLGVEEDIETYEQLDDIGAVGSSFGIAKAALALAGFSPRCQDAFRRWQSLRAQLEDFGGGLELNLLAAVPKGSGLGTSSILAATLLATLNDVCGLEWDTSMIMFRTLVLEQILTTGGGWQDQAGSLYPGVKLIQTEPGFMQTPTVKWLPEKIFSEPETRDCMLLYYTGITRTAKNILSQIVQRMFLNHRNVLNTLDKLADHALDTYRTVQEAHWTHFCRAINKSRQLNQTLDSGTNPPEVQRILDQAGSDLAAAKSPGAGGGGYLFMIAKDPAAARRIRQTLTQHPPNKKARFVGFETSAKGIEVTRS